MSAGARRAPTAPVLGVFAWGLTGPDPAAHGAQSAPRFAVVAAFGPCDAPAFGEMHGRFRRDSPAATIWWPPPRPTSIATATSI